MNCVQWRGIVCNADAWLWHGKKFSRNSKSGSSVFLLHSFPLIHRHAFSGSMGVQWGECPVPLRFRVFNVKNHLFLLLRIASQEPDRMTVWNDKSETVKHSSTARTTCGSPRVLNGILFCNTLVLKCWPHCLLSALDGKRCLLMQLWCNTRRPKNQPGLVP